MDMSQLIRTSRGWGLVSATMVLLAVHSALWGQEQAAPGAFLVRPGVVVDRTTNRVYVMRPQGGIEARDIEGGEQAWSTDVGDKPLAVMGRLLLAQAENPAEEEGNRLQIVGLDHTQRGEQVSLSEVGLPGGVRASVGKTPMSSFDLTVLETQGDLFVSWTHSTTPLRGFEPEDSLPPERRSLIPDHMPQVLSGLLRLDLSARTLTPVSPEEFGALPPRPRQDLPPSERLAEAGPGPQFLSADGRHVLVSERVADERVWEKYRWTIFERATQRRLGDVANHESMAPFFVSGSLVIFEAVAYQRRDEPAQPLALRAVDMETGEEVWVVEIRDTQGRGLVPPG